MCPWRTADWRRPGRGRVEGGAAWGRHPSSPPDPSMVAAIPQAAPARATQVVSVMAPYTKADHHLEIVVIIGGRQVTRFRHHYGPPRWYGPLRPRWRRSLCQEQGLGSDHLLVVVPLLNGPHLPSASQTTNFLALLPLRHGCPDPMLWHVHLGIDLVHLLALRRKAEAQ